MANCIVCGSHTRERFLGRKESIYVSFCKEHAEECVDAGAACWCE